MKFPVNASKQKFQFAFVHHCRPLLTIYAVLSSTICITYRLKFFTCTSLARLRIMLPPKPTGRLLLPRILEVERKFAPTPTSLHLLRHNAGNPPFLSFKSRGVTRFHDIYYDFNNTKAGGGWLMQHGIYVRARNGIWVRSLGFKS